MDYRNMDYRERYKLQYGYTDEMLQIDDLMEELAAKRSKARVLTHDETVYIGVAGHYCKADDEEDGFATFSVDTEDKGSWCLGVNEIKSISEIT